MILAMLRMG